MRIIAGKHRGRILAEFAGKDIRPTSDRVKESLFNILSMRIPGSRVLDLFCGSGALGLECISRGADECVFNDVSKDSLLVLKKNLALLKEDGKVYNYDYRRCLLSLTGKFDLIFIDPPYAYDCISEILAIIYERGLLKEDGLVVYESERKNVEVEHFNLKDERFYGRTYLGFYGREV